MFADFLRGPHDSEGAMPVIKKIQTDFVTIASKQAEEEVQIYCDLCNSNFISNGHKYQHW